MPFIFISPEKERVISAAVRLCTMLEKDTRYTITIDPHPDKPRYWQARVVPIFAAPKYRKTPWKRSQTKKERRVGVHLK